MPNTVDQHQQARPSVQLRGFGYSTYATVALLPASGQPGEIVYVAATGQDYQWNPSLSQWVPWFNNGTVLRANITGAATANVSGRGAAELTLTGNVTGLTISGWDTDNTKYQRVRFQIKQDATGNRAFAWAGVNGTWLETPPSTLDTTSGASSLQFYASTTDGGTTVWLEPIGLAYAEPCVYMQVAETTLPAVAAGGQATISHSYATVYGCELIEVATGQHVVPDWKRVTPTAATSDLAVTFTNAIASGQYKAQVAGLASQPCVLTVTASEWLQVTLAVTAATTLTPTVSWTGGNASSVQWVWGDGTITTPTSGTATSHTYGSAYTGNVVLRWRRGTTITLLQTLGTAAWTYNLRAISNLTGLTNYAGFGTGITGDLAAFTPMTSLAVISVPGLAITGNLVALPATATTVNLSDAANVTGNLSVFSGRPMVVIGVHHTNVTGDLSAVAGMAATLNNLQLSATATTGDITTLAGFGLMSTLAVDQTSIVGDPSIAIASMAQLKVFQFYNMGQIPTTPQLDQVISTLAAGAVNNGILQIYGNNPPTTNNAGIGTLTGRGWSVLHN
jgi:hypothetical protein